MFFVCTLTLLLASGASARIISWEDEDGVKTMIVEIEDFNEQYIPFPGTQSVYHTEGAIGDICSYSGSYDVTLEASYVCPLQYETYLRQILDGNGHTLSRRVTGTMQNERYEVAASFQSGNYCVGVAVVCNYGSWSVANDIAIGGLSTRAISLATGRINYVPWDVAEDSGLENFYYMAVPCDNE